MGLEKFVGSRLIVQSPATRLYDAVRAMLDNRIGTVLVHDGKALAGIVTDRDLGLGALADDLDAYEFTLWDVMSSPVASVSTDSTVSDVTDLMIRERVRRIPILDGAVIEGIVTLDDLILERATDSSTLAAILRAQLSQPARLKVAAGKLHPVRGEDAKMAQRRAERRHATHESQAYARFLRRTLGFTELKGIECAEEVLEIALSALLSRVTPEEAKHFLAQLPRRLQQTLRPALPSRADLGMTRAFIERELQRRLQIGADRAAQLLDQVGRAVQAGVSAGEIRDFTSQLPADMKSILAG